MAKDEEFIHALKTGDSKYIEHIYREYLPAISQFVNKNNGNNEDARDIFQEALVILHQKLKQPGFELTSSVFTYIFAICKNLWLKRLEKSRKLKVTFLDQQELSIVDELDSHIEKESQYRLYRKKFRELTAGCQKILELFFGGHSMKEITKIMDFGSVQYTKKRKFKCKEKLISLIQEDDQFKELT